MNAYSSIKISGTGHALPDEVITNACLHESAGLSDEWILARTGIRERRRANTTEKDARCPVNLITGESLEFSARTILCNAIGFGGFYYASTIFDV